MRSLTFAIITVASVQAVIAAPTRDDMLNWLEEYRYASEGPAPGTVVGISNIDELEPFLPPGFSEEFRFPEVAVEMEQTYRFIPPPEYLKATAQSPVA